MSEFSVLGDFFRVFSQIKESYPIFYVLCSYELFTATNTPQNVAVAIRASLFGDEKDYKCAVAILVDLLGNKYAAKRYRRGLGRTLRRWLLLCCALCSATI